LLAKYKQGQNQNDLANLYMRYKGLVYGVCYKYLNDSDAANDAIMDIYQELVPKCLKHDIENFAPWLHTLARNHCLMKMRKSKNIVSFEEDFMQNDNLLHLDDEMEKVQQKEAQLNGLEKCLGLLEDAQKQSVILFYLEEKCYNEIAEITGLDWNKVRSFIQNGRRNLKICLEKQQNAAG
jgi:RNA polymerase sigma factor (sigma-70 family)